jgi:hypothetical protein
VEKQQNVREKLVELLDKGPAEYAVGSEGIADYLIAHGVTVQEWISVEAGELQNYIGVPVCIKRKTDGECWWAIIRGIKGDKVSTDYGGYFKLSEYGETWMVKCLPLPQPPKGE